MDLSRIAVWGVGTPRTFRVHWLLHELGLEYATHPIQSRTGETQTAEYLELNTRGKIPALVDGELVVTESAAILRYLRRTYPVLPYDAYQLSSVGQASYDEWLSFILMELDATSLYVVRRHRDLPEIYGEAANAVSSSLAYFSKMLGSVEARVAGREFLWGESFSELDIHMTVILLWAKIIGIEVPAAFDQYSSRMTARPAYRVAYAHNFQ